MCAPNQRFTDSINENGQTPFLLSVCTGNIPVMNALLLQKSDPLVRDKYGNTVFTLLCKNSLLWALHFMVKHFRLV
jgi:ankyrin repeat protein